MRMGFLLLLRLAMRYVQIGLRGALLPNCLVADCKYVAGTVLAIDLFVLIVHLFEGVKLWTRFVWFRFSDRSVS